MEDAIVGNRDFLKGQILGMVGRSWTSESRKEVLGKSNSGESGSSPRDAAGWGWQSGVETKSIRCSQEGKVWLHLGEGGGMWREI